MRLPTRLDRYPAKMVSKLAGHLVERYALNARRILDPFCGSGAILVAARSRGIPVSGIDINPIAELFFNVKLKGFNPVRAFELAQIWIEKAQATKKILPIQWDAKHYWFTDATIKKFERLRFASMGLNLRDSNEGMAALLSYMLSVRLCSKADQRSPKPFISKQARELRGGKHFDPYRTIIDLLTELSTLYEQQECESQSQFLLADITNTSSNIYRLGKHSHIITSPPYINAQDYFRNFKLELYLLEGILPFQINDLQECFIGTERGDLLFNISKDSLEKNKETVPYLKQLERKDYRLAAVVHRYFNDMGRAFDTMKNCLDSNGCFILVCGDNLIKGFRIRTWQVLQSFLEDRGFRLFDQFTDPIEDRLLPPKRCGHKGLIKEEIVSAFYIPKEN